MKTRQPVWNDLLYKEGKTNDARLFEKTELVNAKKYRSVKMG